MFSSSLLTFWLFIFQTLIGMSKTNAASPTDYFRHFSKSSSSRHASNGSGSGSGDDFYNILGISRDSNTREVKTAYRKKTLSMHPDKGGNAEEFKKLVEAYEVLSDPQKREIYDRYGSEGLRQGAFNGGSNADNMGPFGDIFKGFSSFASIPVVYNLELSLEDLFSGRQLALSIQGNIVKLDIPPGTPEGTEIVCDLPGGRQVVFNIQEKGHQVYQRRNADLLLKMRLSLADALLGCDKKITLLNGQVVTLKIGGPEGLEALSSGVLIIENLGMPVMKANGKTRNSESKGRLFIQVSVDLPKKLVLSESDRSVLERLLLGINSTGKSVHSVDSFGNNTSLNATNSKVRNISEKTKSEKVHVFSATKGDLNQFGKVGMAERSFHRSPFDDYRDEDEFSSFSSFFFR